MKEGYIMSTCEACDQLLEEERTGAPRSEATTRAMQDRMAHLILPVPETQVIPGDKEQAERDYAPVHQAHLKGTNDAERLWELWQERWGDRFTAVCHDVITRYGG
jgi:hypothetical protein